MITDIQKTIKEFEAKQRKAEPAKLTSGDHVKVHFKIVEGDKERIQVFQGDIIRILHGDSARATFTVRKNSFGVGVESTFPLHSPLLDKVEVVRHGRTRRAKLYYLRSRIGRATRLKEVR